MDILIKKFIDELPTEATIKSDLEKCTKAFNDNLDKLKESTRARLPKDVLCVLVKPVFNWNSLK